MNDLDPRLRHLFWFVAELFAALLSALALLLIIVRLALPQAEVFKPQLEAWFSQALGETVRIGAVNAHWPGLDLTVVLDDVALLDPDGTPRIEFDRAYVSLDPLASLRQGAPALSELHIDGLQVGLFGDIFAETADPAPPPVAPVGVAVDDVGWFLPWLLAQNRVDVTSGQLLWHDPVSDQPQANGFSLRARHVKGRHTVAVHLDTRDGTGVIELVAELDGAAASPEAWQGRLYLRGQRVQWRGVALLAEQAFPGSTDRLIPYDDAYGLPGLVDFEIWGDLDDGALRRLAGEVAVSAPGTHQLVGIARVATRFDWLPSADGWELAIDGVEVDPVGGDRFRTGPAGVRYLANGGTPVVEAGLASLDLAMLRQLVAHGNWFDADGVARIDAIAPRGQLYDLRGRWEAASGAADARWRVAGELWDIHVNPWEWWPGIEGLRIGFDVGPDGGRGDLFGRGTRVTLPWLFREPLVGDRVEGEVRVLRDTEGWRLASDRLEIDNAHIRTATRLDLLLPDDGAAPIVDLGVGYRDGDASEAWRYLPVGIMPKAVVAWLDHALASGRVVGGGMVLHGPLDRFPFDDRDGRFQVRFQTDDVTLDYLEGWPRIEGLGAWVTFDGRGMRIDGREGRILGAALGPTVADAPDLTADDARLKIDGRVSGDAGAGLRYLRESPLRERFGDYLAVAEASGRLDLGLDLDIALATGDTEVEGVIDLAKTNLDLPAFGIRVEQGQGRLEFDNRNLVGKGLTATWRGMPVEVDVRVPDDPGVGRHGPRIGARGRAGAAQLAELLPAPLAARLVGEFDWQTVVGVDETEGGGVSGVRIEASSDLAGFEVRLPAPLGKAADRTEPLRIEAQLPDGAPPRLQANYGPLTLVAELEAGEAGVRVPRAGLAVGQPPATLPDASLWHADLRGAQLDLAAWAAVAAELEAPAAGGAARPPLRVDARFDAVPLGEAFTLHDVEAQVTEETEAWRIVLASQEATGSIAVPRTAGREPPVEARFERVALAYAREPTGDDDPEPAPDTSRPDPRSLPGLRLAIDRLVVNNHDLGNLTLHADPVSEGLRIRQLALDAPDWILTGTGRWEFADTGGRTAFDLALDTGNFDALYAALFGQADLKVAETRFNAHLGWPGAPHQLRLATLEGSVQGHIANGVLPEVDPGVGRLFSLVNLSTIGRRLTLDFSDLLDKGLRFDTIDGRFVFADGDAFTNDLLVQTTAATVSIMGRTGLVVRDYDQVMTVLPEVSSALPIAGAVLGGPAVGAALLVFNEVFSSELDELARVQYRVTGPWEAPEVVRIQSKGDPVPSTENR